MNALHRLKAYFGMVPIEDLDDFGPDYPEDHRRDGYRTGRDFCYEGSRLEGSRFETSRYEASRYEDARYAPDAAEPGREHAYAARPVRRRSRRTDPDDYRSYHDDLPAEPVAVAPARLHSARGSACGTDAPVRGSLAVDPTPPVRAPLAPLRTGMFAEAEAHPLARIVTLHPRSYNEARQIGERYREGAPVIMNLTGMDDKDAKRLVDFAAGLAFALRGSIDKVTNKVFLLSPPNVEVSAEDRRRIAEGGLFNQR